MGYWLTVGVIALGLAVVFVYPLADGWMVRRDIKNRILDRIEEEWDSDADDAYRSLRRDGWGGW